ncbi:MAG TPA: ABC transporter substrate-binding protein, partial [Polyangiaceae bacterium]|nr:ABC transporter substrate-binding protein [Polyangiaceae bacterium]
LQVLVGAFEARGHEILELSAPHEQAGLSPLVSLILAGKPPNLFAASQTNMYREIRDRGLGQTLGDHFRSIGAWEKFPPIVREVISVDGEVRKIPTGIHVDGMLYYNTKVAAAAGVDPRRWKTIDEMFADLGKVQQAGYNFMAVGGNTFQAGYLFHALLAAVGGRRVFYDFFRDTPKLSVFESPELRRTIDLFRRITSQADPGWSNRSWAESTNTVISGKTLMHYHGDWMKGQWRAQGKHLGADFNCINLPGAQALSVTVDALGVLGGKSVTPETLQAELDFATVVVDPAINGEFAARKGATPVRTDAPASSLDQCNQLVLNSLKEADSSVQNPFYVGDGDWINSVWNALYTFQCDAQMSTDELIRRLYSEYRAIFR